MPLGKVFLGPRADRLRKRTAIGTQLRETCFDFSQMFFAELGHFPTRFATVILQIKDSFYFIERQTQRLCFLDESDATKRFRRVKPVVCGRAFWFLLQAESLVIVQRLRTDSHFGCDLADLQSVHWSRM